MKFLEKKIQHHYVWAHYLREWSADRKNIWYISATGKVSNDGIKGLAREDNFYKIGEIKDGDLDIMKIILKDTHPKIKALQMDLVSSIITIQKIAEIYSPKVEMKLNINLRELMASNQYEEYFSSMERRAVELIKSLKSGSMEHVTDKIKYYELCHFVAHQYSRTIKMKRILIDGFHKFEKTHGNLLLKDFFTRNWWFMCSFYAGNLSFDMAMNKSAAVCILNNETNVDFITSDQPVLNINPDGANGENIDYYYPVSPKKALFIKTSNREYFDSEKITDDDVCFLNKEMALQCYKTIFSASEKGIVDNKKSFEIRRVKENGFL